MKSALIQRDESKAGIIISPIPSIENLVPGPTPRGISIFIGRSKPFATVIITSEW